MTATSVAAQDAGNVSVHLPPRLALVLGKAAPGTESTSVKKAGTTKGASKMGSGKEIADVNVRINTAKSSRKEILEVKEISAKEKKAIVAKPAKLKLATEEERAAHHAVSGMSAGGRFARKGFRVQIYNGPSREEALRRKSEFMRSYPGVHTYLIYQSPHYKLKVGDYRRRNDALGMFHEANGTYSPCMIVPDMVSIHND